jgi:hypothetical protein
MSMGSFLSDLDEFGLFKAKTALRKRQVSNLMD